MLESYFKKGVVEAGCDEAGRGCLAGPVYAAAVILPPDFHHEMLNDSKQLSEKKRYLLREVIQKEAIAWAVGIVDNQEIDKLNILRSSILAMHRALDDLKTRPEEIIVDGNRFYPYRDLPHTTHFDVSHLKAIFYKSSIGCPTYDTGCTNRFFS